MKPADLDRVFGRSRLRMVTGAHVEVYREPAAPGERRRYTKRFLATEAGDFRLWTEREWRILARLVGHGVSAVPEVVRFDRGSAREPALVQTYDAGVTLDHWVTLLPVQRHGQVLRHVFEDCAHWWALARQALAALDAVHALGLVHLDLKADNLCIPVAPADLDPHAAGVRLYPAFEQMALIDFAFSLISGEALTMALPLAREPNYDYQSPRLLAALDAARGGDLRPTRELDWRCDFYSLAALLARYLPDAYHPLEAGWTPQLLAQARGFVRRLLALHDAPLPAVPQARPHAEMVATAAAVLADTALDASLQRGWVLATTAAPAGALTPTPITRVAPPLVAGAQSAPVSAVTFAAGVLHGSSPMLDGMPEAALPPSLATVPTREPLPVPRPRRGARGALVAGGGMAVLALGAALAYPLWQRGGGERESSRLAQAPATAEQGAPVAAESGAVPKPAPKPAAAPAPVPDAGVVPAPSALPTPASAPTAAVPQVQASSPASASASAPAAGPTPAAAGVAVAAQSQGHGSVATARPAPAPAQAPTPSPASAQAQAQAPAAAATSTPPPVPAAPTRVAKAKPAPAPGARSATAAKHGVPNALSARPLQAPAATANAARRAVPYLLPRAVAGKTAQPRAQLASATSARSVPWLEAKPAAAEAVKPAAAITTASVRPPPFLPPDPARVTTPADATPPKPADVAIARPADTRQPEAVGTRPPETVNTKTPEMLTQLPPQDLQSRSRSLMAEAMPRIAERAERLVLRVLHVAAHASGPDADEDVRRAARSLRLAPPEALPAAAPQQVRALAEASQQQYRRGDLPGAIDLLAQAFAANPLDPQIVSDLAWLRLRANQPEQARQLALHALTTPDAAAPHGRVDDWASLATANALLGRERDATLSWFVALALSPNPERLCRQAINSHARHGEALRRPVDALLQRAQLISSGLRPGACEWPGTGVQATRG